MSIGEVIAYTVALIVIAGITAGLWLNLLMWIPMLLVGAVFHDDTGFAVVRLLSMLVAGATVLLVGILALDLPWYAASVAGLFIGITSYAQPNAAHPSY
jgi:hypothetical protein